MFSKTMIRGLLAVALVASAVAVQANVFQMPTGQTSLETVWVANTKNAADTTVMNDSTSGYGTVDYAYQMGTYEVTNAQYTQFLNAKLPTISDAKKGTVLTSDTYGLFNVFMDTQIYGGIRYTPGAATGAKFAAKSGYENRPVNYVSWYDSLRFANWLQNSQGTGSTESGTYTITTKGRETQRALRSFCRFREPSGTAMKDGAGSVEALVLKNNYTHVLLVRVRSCSGEQFDLA